MKITGNEPVNRVIDREDNGYGVMNFYVESEGLTIRQHFAAMAMQGYIASHTGELTPKLDDVSKRAVAHADALIAELNETPNPNE